MAAIVLEQVSKHYPTASGVLPALQEVSLRVEAGEIVALVGPSGCGKSTLLRLIADLEAPGTGQIEVLGQTPTAARRRRAYGIVFQEPALLDWRDVTANVALPLELAGLPPPSQVERADELVRLVGLSEFAGAYPRQLSGGMRQRVAVARALALRPGLLLMDEPFSALDELTREALQGELLTFLAAARDTTVLFVTHNLSEAAYLADRVVVLTPRPGRVRTVVSIELPRPRLPRLRDDPVFHAAVTRLRGALGG